MKTLGTCATEIFDLCRGDHNTDQIAALIQAFMADQAPAYHVPGPYEIALAMGAGLAASGLYATPGAAMAAAWASIPEFWQARNHYLNEIAPAFYGQAANTPGGEVAEADEFHA